VSERFRFVAIGDLMVDVSVSGHGHEARVQLRPGGAATNAARSAAQAGADVMILGRIGDDAGGRMLERELARGGVATALTVDAARPTGTFLVVDGELRADRGANAGFLPEHVPTPLDATITLVSGHLPEATIAAALERSRARWNALAAARLRVLPDGGNAVFLDGAAATAITGLPPLEAIVVLGERYRLVCVTLGADGALALLDGCLEQVVPETRIASDGVFGAGDALAATVLVAVASGRSLGDALGAGCHAATLVLTRQTARHGERRGDPDAG
jgi:sugar/nucleoside kinase (ribokinase family)